MNWSDDPPHEEMNPQHQSEGPVCAADPDVQYFPLAAYDICNLEQNLLF
jgi:hypothetical protein